MRRSLTMSIAAIAAFGLITPVANAAVKQAEPSAVQPSQLPARTEADAVRQARETGRQVEVADQTTETTQLLANPNGTFTMKSTARAVRVQRDGAWRDIDTTLIQAPDGSLAPVATAQDVRFSGGGTAPLVTLRHEGRGIAFSWPSPLPSPTITGNTAVYAGVLPGVDLRVTAEADSYSQVLVVHDAAAAANPALASIRLTATGTGVHLAVRPDGGLSATDPGGTEVFHGPAPVMWDSRHDDQVGPRPTATDQGSGHVTRLGVTGIPRTSARAAAGTSTTDLTLTPDPAALTGPGVTYPLYIDPTMSVRKQHWLRITDNGWSNHWDDSGAEAQVGYCGGWPGCDGWWRARSFFQLDSTPLMPRNGVTATIFRAQFFAYQIWSADHNCQGGQPTDVWETDTIRPDTPWPGPLSVRLNTQWSNAGGPCAAGNLIFDVRTTANNAASRGWPYVTFALVANNENERLQWKRFANDPVFEVDFSFPPNNATGLRVSNEVRCTGKVITSDANPVLYASASDNNSPPLMPALWHHVWTANDSRTISGRSGIRISSGTEGQWRIPDVDRLSDGDWKFRVYVDNNPGHPWNLHNPANGGFSPWYNFTVDATPPVAPYIERSHDYPSNYWGLPSGAPGGFSIFPNGEIAGYTYTFLGAGTEVLPSSTDCNYNRTFGTNGGWVPYTVGAQWIPVPPGLSPGFHTVHVRSFDQAHNLSPEISRTFYVAPNTGLGTQRFEAENLTRTQPAGQNVTVGAQPNCCNTTWSGNNQLLFQGNASGQSLSLRLDVATEGDYQLWAGMTNSTDYGQVTFAIDGQPIGGWPYEGYNPVVATAPLRLVVKRFTAGQHWLTITTSGTHPQSTGSRYRFGIDYVTLTQSPRYEAEQSAQLPRSQPPGQNVSLEPETYSGSIPGPGPFSDRQQLLFAATAPGQSFSLTFRAPVEADYALGIELSKLNRYGTLRIDVDGNPMLRTDTTPWDAYHPSAEGWGYTTHQPLGGAHLTAGEHKLTITVVGKHPDSLGYQAGVDFLVVTPINNITAATITDAMNNDGISSDGTPATFDLGGTSLSAQTLAAAGYGPGATATINGATFTMPAARPNGADNVIAIGQKIPFLTAVQASGVGLLVAATCGRIPAASATITYTDTSTQNSPVPEVEDWASGWPDLADVVLPYRNEGTAANRAIAPRLYAVVVPANPAKTLQSITLPNYGTSLLPGSCSPALHVLSIAPRSARPGWLGAWAAPSDIAAPPAGGVGFANQTLRTVIHPTLTGTSARIRLSNSNATGPVTFGAVTVAAQAGTGAATLATPVALTFGGSAQVTIPAGGEALSDPVAFPEGGSGNLIVSMHVSSAVNSAAVHGYPTAPTWLASGNASTDSTGSPFTTRLGGIRYLTGLEVSTSDTTQGTIAVLGDQLTAIAPPGADYRPTWVDVLPSTLATAGVPVPGSLVNVSQAGLSPGGHWRLDDATGTTARDTAGSADATLTGGATWSPDRGGSVTLNGSTACLTTAGRVLVTSGSYTVSAWVKLNAIGTAAQTVVSHDGTDNNAFALQYTGTADNKWSFTLPATSLNGATPIRVLSRDPASRGVWTHLIGSYDATTKVATLYVNRAWQGWASHTTPWSSAGPLAIGRGKANGTGVAFLNGSVSDVRIYQRAIDDHDAGLLYLGNPVPGDQPGLGALSATRASATLNRTVLSQPSLRTVILAVGSNDLLAGRTFEETRQALTNLSYSASPTGIRNHRRPDGTPIHVIATTIPPLGLPDTDPREQARRALNSDLLANFTSYGAQDIVDLATALQDPTHPNQLNPTLLTNGTPNPTYHTTIAQTIADAASRFPPEARL